MGSRRNKNWYSEDELKKYNKQYLSYRLHGERAEKNNDVITRKKLHDEKYALFQEQALKSGKEVQIQKAEESKQRDEELAIAMQNIKREEICKEKIRQQAWESRELLDLQGKLKQAYYQKELAHKMQNDQLLKIQKQEENKAYVEYMLRQQQFNELCEQRAREKSEKIKQAYKESLQDQIIDRHKLKIAEYKKDLHEAALINDAVRIVAEEDKRIEEEKQKKKEAHKLEIETFQKARDVWLSREKKLEEEQEKEIARYLVERNEREKKLQEENRKKEDFKLKQQEAVVSKIHQLEGLRHEREKIAEILLEEEERVKEEERQRKQQDDKVRFKQETMTIFQTQLEMKLAQKEKERREDEEYAKELRNQIEIDKQKEREEAIKLRQAAAKYMEELKQGLADHYRHKFEELMLRIKEEDGLQAEREAQRKIIDDERIRLINEHAPHLVGFLPNGIIRDSDLQHLHPELQKYYSSK